MLAIAIAGTGYFMLLAWASLQVADRFERDSAIYSLIVFAPFLLFFATVGLIAYWFRDSWLIQSTQPDDISPTDKIVTDKRQQLEDSITVIVSLTGALALICSAVAFPFLKDFVVSRPTSTDRLVHGTVVARELYEVNALVSRPRLTIEIEESRERVSAVLLADGINDFGDPVSFYYSGDSTEEVYLLNETNPLWIGLSFVAAPFVIGGVMIFLLKRDPRRKRSAR